MALNTFLAALSVAYLIQPNLTVTDFVSPAQLTSAIARGDAAAVVAYGGTPRQVVAALKAKPHSAKIDAILSQLETGPAAFTADKAGRTGLVIYDDVGKPLVAYWPVELSKPTKKAN